MKELADAPFALVGVNSDPDRTALADRLVEENITWRSFWNGPDGSSGPISRAWNVNSWPTIWIIDHEGVIRHKGHGGKATDAALREWLEVAAAAR